MPAVRTSNLNSRSPSPNQGDIQDGEKEYTVVLRGHRFTLYESQILYDAPNYFTSAFMGEFSESSARTVRLHRNPELFALILEYLSGYKILPLRESGLPRTMTREVALENLIADAQFYGLDGLCQLLTSPTNELSSRRLRGVGFSDMVVSLRDIINDKLPDHVEWDNDRVLYRESEDSAWKAPLVFAQDVSLMIFFSHIARVPEVLETDWPDRELWNDGVHICIAIGGNLNDLSPTFEDAISSWKCASHFQFLADYSLWSIHPSWQNIFTTPDIYVNGVGGMLGHLYDWWEAKFYGTGDGGSMTEEFRPFDTAFPQLAASDLQHWQPTHFQQVLYADEVIFRICGSRNEHSLQAILHHIKARSMQSIMHNISPLSSKWQRDFGLVYDRMQNKDLMTLPVRVVEMPDGPLEVYADDPLPFTTSDTLSVEVSDTVTVEFAGEQEVVVVEPDARLDVRRRRRR